VQESDDPMLVASKPGARIELADVDARMLQIPAEKRAGFINDPERIEQLLQSMILMRQVAGAARARGLDQDPLVALEVQLAVEEVLAKRMLASQQATVELPDFSLVAEERYASDPSAFDTLPSVDVRHLLVKRELHGDAGARAHAEALRTEFLAGSVGFEDFVKQHSEEPRAAEHGGLVKTLLPGKADGPFERAAFALREPGELSEVVASSFGYHLIQLIARQPSRRRSFDEVKPTIVEQLQAQYLQEARTNYLASFQSQPLTANPANVLALRSRYLPDGEGARRLQALEGTGNGASDQANATDGARAADE
jgi:peptidyl-prolyl cis-trans isomerase C